VGYLVAEVFVGIPRKTTLNGFVGGLLHADFCQGFNGIKLGSWRDNPGLDQVEKHLVLAACRIQAEELEGPANRVQEKTCAFTGYRDGIINRACSRHSNRRRQHFEVE